MNKKTFSAALEDLEKSRRGQSSSQLLRAFGSYIRAVHQDRNLTAQDVLRDALADEETRLLVSATLKNVGGARQMSEREAEVYRAAVRTSNTEADTFGSGQVPVGVADIIQSLVPVYGVHRDLGVTIMPAGTTKVVRVTALPTPGWIQPNQQPTALTPDTTLAGDAVTASANSLGVLIEPSMELLDDQSVDATAAFLIKCGEGLAKGLDTVCFSGTGANDTTNGGQTGIFPNGAVPNVTANAGNITAAALQRADFMAAVAAIVPAALKRECRFWVNPIFLPALMVIAFLLGWDCAAHVSRYEHFRRTPNLRTALALHVILQTSMPELFGGQYLKVEKAIRRRAARLVARLSKGPVPANAAKLALLRSMAAGTSKRI